MKSDGINLNAKDAKVGAKDAEKDLCDPLRAHVATFAFQFARSFFSTLSLTGHPEEERTKSRRATMAILFPFGLTAMRVMLFTPVVEKSATSRQPVSFAGFHANSFGIFGHQQNARRRPGVFFTAGQSLDERGDLSRLQIK